MSQPTIVHVWGLDQAKSKKIGEEIARMFTMSGRRVRSYPKGLPVPSPTDCDIVVVGADPKEFMRDKDLDVLDAAAEERAKRGQV